MTDNWDIKSSAKYISIFIVFFLIIDYTQIKYRDFNNFVVEFVDKLVSKIYCYAKLDNCSAKLAVLIIVQAMRAGYSWEFDENEPRSSNIQTPERLADD